MILGVEVRILSIVAVAVFELREALTLPLEGFWIAPSRGRLIDRRGS